MDRTQKMIQKYMMQAEDEQTMFVCVECVKDPILRRISSGLYKERCCISCGKQTRQALTPQDIADRVRKYLPNHFEVDGGLYPGYEMDLASVVSSSIGCSSILTCEVIAGLLVEPESEEESFYWRDQVYQRIQSPFFEEKDERDYIVGDWLLLAHELTHGRRFFNDKVRGSFGALIGEALRAEDPDVPGLHPVINVLPKGTDFYRARVVNNRSDIKDVAVDLGAPPKERAANNRMSAAGIPLLYVSGDPKTCISELRPSIGDSVAVGRFSSSSDLKLFDFTALERKLKFKPISFFDDYYEERSNRIKLLTYLHAEIARPLRANALDYVVTQALAEFIRHETGEDFDGIIFRSVQNKGGINYVLFDKGDTVNTILPGWRQNFNLEASGASFEMYKVDFIDYESSIESQTAQRKS
ncbi:RES family NAD+ phosphorylase [Pseudomonas fluorescens]|uniref:RES family NAD+ phosphorylase n=1 Tax=Pseudomonas fluorescens TaxID=294 RepID=UPI000699438B|nr:RES family NAD+ phosphorylase [Pseudomonas fluorescens]